MENFWQAFISLLEAFIKKQEHYFFFKKNAFHYVSKVLNKRHVNRIYLAENRKSILMIAYSGQIDFVINENLE